MKRIVALALLSVCLSAAGVSGAASHRVAGDTVFTDSTGEDAAGPDITTVTASSDVSTLAFHIAIPSNPSVTPDFRLRVWLDADDSLETGLNVEGSTGFDHFLLVDPTRFRPDEAVLYSCSGSTCSGPSSSPPEFSYSGGARLDVDARSLGLPRIERVKFSVTATTGIRFDPATGYDLTDAHIDVAPDAGSWTYDSRALRVTSFRAVPPQPRTGGPLRLTVRVVRTDTGAAVTRGKVTCSLTVGRRDIEARSAGFVGERARCVLDVPAGTAGRRYRATIGVAARDAVVKRSISGRVRK